MMFRLLAFSVAEWSWPLWLVLLLFLLLTIRWVLFIIWIRKHKKRPSTQLRVESSTVVRVAFLYKSWIYLCPRSTEMRTHISEIDLPFETATRKGESVEHALQRALTAHYGSKIPVEVRYSIKYRYKVKPEERITYLFLVDVNDEKLLPSNETCRCKLWTMRLIELNVGKGYFSPYFEQELSHWKMVLDLWNQYRNPMEKIAEI